MSLGDLYARYHDQVQFLMVYIREAHPVDGWWFGRGLSKYIMRLFSAKVSMDLYDPVTIEERRAAAGECEASLQYGVKTYVALSDRQRGPGDLCRQARTIRI